MQQKWLLAVVGVVGVVLAVALFPKPGGTEDLPSMEPVPTQQVAHENTEEDPEQTDPMASVRKESRNGESARRNPAGNIVRRNIDPGQIMHGPNPLAAEMMKRRAEPASVYAGRISSPWAVIRRELVLMDTPESLELSSEIAEVVTDLRALRRDPEAMSWEEVEADLTSLSERLHGGADYMDNSNIVKSVERSDSMLAEARDALDAEQPE